MLRIIRLDENKLIVETKYVNDEYVLKNDESFSETGIVGQIQQQDGTFIDPEPIPIEPQPNEPTNSEIAQMISDLQADLIIAGVI